MSSCLFCDMDGSPCDHAAAAALAAMPEWSARAYRMIQELAARGRPFTSETITEALGFPSGEQGANRNNSVGAVIRLAAADGLIHSIGTTASRNRSSHGARLAIWRGRR